jgi:hypothetical protein
MRASTSIAVYHNEIKGEKEDSQDSIILSAFVAINKPASARMVQKYLKDIGISLDINVVSRSVNNLHSPKDKEARIILFGACKCEVTGRTVNHYESILKLGTQTKLF